MSATDVLTGLPARLATLTDAVPPYLLPLLVVAGGLLVAFVGAWLLMHYVWRPLTASGAHGNTKNNKNLNNNAGNGSQWLAAASLKDVGAVTVASATEQGQGLYESIKNVLAVVFNPTILLGLGAVFAVSLVLYFAHPTLLGTALECRQCLVRPLIDHVVLPLLNLVRLVYAAVIWLWNAAAEVAKFIFSGWKRVLYDCTTRDMLERLVRRLFAAVGDAMYAVAQWIATGLFSGERIMLAPALADALSTVNETRPTLDCFCAAVAPVWDLALALPQSPSLPVALDAGANVGARAVQFVLSSIGSLWIASPHNLTVEVNTLITAAGDTVEDWVQSLIQFFLELFTLLDGLFNASTPVQARLSSLYAARVAGLPPAATVASAPERPLLALSTFWHATMGTYRAAAPLLETLNVTDLAGADALLRLAATPWSRIVTQPVCALVSLANMTVTALINPAAVFASPGGLAYFQLGHLFDRLRASADAMAQLTVLIDRALPCPLSQDLQAFLHEVEGVLELAVGYPFFLAAPPWLPGVPPPVLCAPNGTVVCGVPAPANWTFVDYFPAYYDWSGNSMRRGLARLEAAGECAAFILGCNTSALNNNATLDRSNCTEAPVACLARSLNTLLAETLNQTLQFTLYVPELVQFAPAPRHAFGDLSWERWRDAWYAFVDCVGALVDLLDRDGTQCLTSDEPPYRPPPNPNATLVRDPPLEYVLTGALARTSYECDSDGRGYYRDGLSATDFELDVSAGGGVFRNVFRGRQAVQRTTLAGTGEQRDMPITCDPVAARACTGQRWTSTSGAVRVAGNPVAGGTLVNLTLAVMGLSGSGEYVNVSYDVDTNTFLNTAPSAGANLLLDAQLNCTDAAPRTWPAPLGLACWNTQWIYAEPYSSLQPRERVGTLPALALANVTCGFRVSPPVTPMVTVPGGTLFTVREYDGLTGQWLDTTVVAQLSTNPLVEVALLRATAAGDTDMPLGAMCVRGQLVGLDAVPAVTYRNSSNLLPVYYVSALTGKRTPVACDALLPDTWPADAPYVADFGDNTTATLEVAAPPANVPACRALRLSVAGGAELIEVVVEGADVRVVYNQSVVQTFTCDATTLASVSAAATTLTSANWAGATTVPGAMNQYWRAGMDRAARDSQRTPTRLLQLDSVALAYLAAADPARYHTQSLQARALYAVAAISIANVTGVYRRASFECYVGSAVREVGDFVVSTLWEVAAALRGLFNWAARPAAGPYVPDFLDAYTNLRGGVCDVVRAGAYLVIPTSFECAPLLASEGCGLGATCVSNFGCDLADVGLLLVRIPLVDVLGTVGAVLRGGTSGSDAGGDLFDPAACSADAPGDCFIAFMVSVTTRVIFTVTQVARGAAAIFDCIICALIRLDTPTATCTPMVYAFVDALADLVDGVGAALLTTVFNIVVGIVEMVIYLFSGQLDKFFAALVDRIFVAIGTLVGSIGQLIWNLLLKIPGFGDFIAVLQTIIVGACNVISDVIVFFGGAAVDCTGVVKRAVLAAVLPAEAAAMWANASMPAYAACATAMNTYTHGDVFVMTPAEQMEYAYCALSYLWLAPNVTGTLTTLQCDQLMPALYAAGTRYLDLDPATQAMAGGCVQQRFKAEKVRRIWSWVPHDTFYADTNAGWRLLDDARLAFYAWGQYMGDRDAAGTVAASAAYRAQWAAAGYDMTYLAAATDAVGGAPAALEAALAADNATLQLTLRDYVERQMTTAATTTRKRSIVVGGVRAHDVDRVTALAEALWRPIFQGTDATQNTSLVSAFAFGLLDLADSRVDAVSLAAAPSKAALLAANDTRLLKATTGGLVQSFLDAGSIALRLVRRASTGTTGTGSTTGKRSLLAMSTIDLPLYVWTALRAGLGGLGGAARAAHTAIVSGSGMPSITSWLPSQNGAWPLSQVSRIVASAATTTATMSSLGTGRSRRAQLGAFAAQVQWRTAKLLTTGFRTHAQWRATCASATTATALNTSCTYVEEGIATVLHAVLSATAYLRGNASTEPSFAHSRDQFVWFNAYTFNDSAPALLGDLTCRVRWPSRDTDVLCLVGDPTLAKRRFSDVADNASATWDLLSPYIFGSNSTSNLTTSALTAAAYLAQLAAPASAPGAGRSLPALFLSETGMTAAATTGIGSLGDALRTWVDFLWAQVRSCDYGEELDGSGKRFSTAETVALAAAVALVVMLVVSVLFNGALTTVVASGAVAFAVVFLYALLVLGYSWSVGCATPLPALPLQLADDLLHFAAFTLSPKCSPLASIVNEVDYNATTCYACDGWRAGRWTVPSFTHPRDATHLFGFEDVGYNVGFAVHAWVPAAWLATLRNTTLIKDVLAYPFIAARLAAFDALDLATVSDVLYAQMFWGFWLTLVINVGLILLPIYLVVALLASVFVQVIRLIAAGLRLLLPAGLAVAATATVVADDAALVAGGATPPPAEAPAHAPNEQPMATMRTQLLATDGLL